MSTLELYNFENKPRKVGFEIEYIGVSLKNTAEIIKDLFQGTIGIIHNSLIEVDTSIGIFRIKVDTQILEKLSSESQKNIQDNRLNIEGMAEQLLSPLLKKFIPNEVVCPPVLMSDIKILNPLVEQLRDKGAQGTNASISYAFGLHINPEVYSLEADNILAYLQSFVILYEYLKEKMKIDYTRQATMFASGYPFEYIELILRPNYYPDMKTLIHHYLHYLKSRNYALDVLPLFAYIDERQVKSKIVDPLIKARPTFHFRMPNCRIDDKNWRIEKEWQYWLLIEKLAGEHQLRNMLAALYLENNTILKTLSNDWIILVEKYIKDL